MTTPFVISLKIQGDNKSGVAAVQETSRELERVRASAVSSATGQTAAHEAVARAVRVETAAVDAVTVATRANTRAANENTAAHRRAAAQRANLIFQLNDIGVSLASGMNPLMVAVQQGSQIATIYEGGVMPALRETGRLAAAAAARFGPIAVAAAAGAAAIAGMRHEIEETSGVAVSFGDTFIAVFQVIGGYLYNAFRPQIEAIQGWFSWVWDQVVAGTKNVINFLVREVLLAIERIRTSVEALPHIFVAAGEAAANGFIGAIEWLVQQALQGIDTLISGVNDFINTFGGDALRDALGWDLTIPSLVDPNNAFSLDRIDIGGKEAIEALAELERRHAEVYYRIMTTDYAGEFFSDVQQQAIANYNARLEDTDKAAKKAAEGLKTANGAAERFRQEVDFYRSTFSSFVTDMNRGLREGQGFWQALGNAGANALDKIADRALSMAANGIFDLIFGSIFGALSGGTMGGFGFSASTPLGFGGTKGIYGIPGFSQGGGGIVGGAGSGTYRPGAADNTLFVARAQRGEPFAFGEAAMRGLASNDNSAVTIAPVYNFNGSGFTEAQARRLMAENNRDLIRSMPAALADARRRAIPGAA